MRTFTQRIVFSALFAFFLPSAAGAAGPYSPRSTLSSTAPARETEGRRDWNALALAKVIGLFAVAVLLGSRISSGGPGAASTGVLNGALAQPPARASSAKGGELIGGKYKLVGTIGKGGMGEVFEAMDQSLGRSVAIKKMSAHIASMGTVGRKLFTKEARAVASMHHPAIVDIYDVLDEGPEIYLIFELVRGITLEKMLEQMGRFSFFEAMMICRPICNALAYAHSRDLVHRDIKPANIMVTDGKPSEVKLMDFGVARTVSAKLSEEGAVAKMEGTVRYAMTQGIIGTPAYMSPEAEQGIVCKEADIYSLGVCLYEMLTGAPPFSEAPSVWDKVNKTYPPVSSKAQGLPSAVDLIISRALEPNPEARIRTAKEFLELLEAAAAARF